MNNLVQYQVALDNIRLQTMDYSTKYECSYFAGYALLQEVSKCLHRWQADISFIFQVQTDTSVFLINYLDHFLITIPVMFCHLPWSNHQSNWNVKSKAQATVISQKRVCIMTAIWIENVGPYSFKMNMQTQRRLTLQQQQRIIVIPTSITESAHAKRRRLCMGPIRSSTALYCQYPFLT